MRRTVSGLDAASSQVIDVLEAQEIKERQAVAGGKHAVTGLGIRRLLFPDEHESERPDRFSPSERP
jgi:hypothetical protein